MEIEKAQKIFSRSINDNGYSRAEINESERTVREAFKLGYRLCKVDELLLDIATYEADCNNMTNSEKCKRCNKTCFDSIRDMVKGACE